MLIRSMFKHSILGTAILVASNTLVADDRMVVYANGLSLIEKSVNSEILDNGKFVIKNTDGNIISETIYVENGLMKNVSVKSSYQSPFNFERLINEKITISSPHSGILLSGVLKEYSGNYLVLSHSNDYISQQMGDYTTIRFNENDMYISSDRGMEIPKHDQGIVLTIENDAKDLTVGYLTRGFSWSGAYDLVLNSDDRAQLLGYAQIHNNTEQDIEDVSLELVAGKVSVQQPTRPQMMMAKAAMADSFESAMPTEDKAGDWHRFTVSSVDTLPARSSTRELLFNMPAIDVKKEYTFESNRPLLSPSMYPVDQHTKIYLDLENEEVMGLGRALPSGMVNIYQYDDNRNRIYAGQDRIANLAEGDKARLYMGEAFELKVESNVLREDYEKNHRGTITQLNRLEEFKVVNNKTDDAVVSIYVSAIQGIDVLEVVESTHSYRRVGEYYVFDIPVSGNGKDYLMLKTVTNRKVK